MQGLGLIQNQLDHIGFQDGGPAIDYKKPQVKLDQAWVNREIKEQIWNGNHNFEEQINTEEKIYKSKHQQTTNAKNTNRNKER